jgi:hypothetical protein
MADNDKSPDDIIEDEYGKRTRGCVMCDGTHRVNGKACPRCFDPARYDVPEDSIPHTLPSGEVICSVARIEDVPRRIFDTPNWFGADYRGPR